MSRYAYLLLLPLPFLSFGCDGLSSSSRDDDEDEDDDDDDDDDDDEDGGSVNVGGSAESNIASIVSLLEDCQTRYDEWESEIEDEDDSDELESIFDSIADFEREFYVSYSQNRMGFGIAVENMDEDDREDAFEDYTDDVESPGAQCRSAQQDFSEELTDNVAACEAYFEWYEEQNEGWEDWYSSQDSYEEECYQNDDEDCVYVD